MQTSRWPISKLPIAHLEPFPYHKGEMYVELLDRLAKYVTDQLHPNLRKTVEEMVEELEQILALQHGKYVEGVQDFQRIHDAFMEDVNSALMALNDGAVTDLVNSESSALGQSLRNIFATNDVVESLRSQLEDRGITPESFGVVGDGVTDDTNGLQEWINHIANNGLQGYLPDGIYKHTRSLVFPFNADGFSIQGASKTGTVLQYAAPSTSTGLAGQNISNFHLSNLTIDGGFSDHRQRYHGISLKNPDYVTLSNVFITNFGNSAAMLFADDADSGQFGNVLIENSECDGRHDANNGWNVVNLRDSLITNVYAYNGGTNEHNSPSVGVQFKNNCINSHMVNVYSFGWKIGMAIGGDNINNVAEDCSVTGVDYNSNNAMTIGRGQRNHADIKSVGAKERVISFGVNANYNHVNVDIVNPKTVEPPVRVNIAFNTVVVNSIVGHDGIIGEITPDVRYSTLVLPQLPGTPSMANVAIDNSGRDTNNIILQNSTKHLAVDGTRKSSSLYFDGRDRKAWISFNHNNSTYSFRGNNNDTHLITGADELTPGEDDQTDLGSDIRRFKDLRLSGDVHMEGGRIYMRSSSGGKTYRIFVDSTGVLGTSEVTE